MALATAVIELFFHETDNHGVVDRKARTAYLTDCGENNETKDVFVNILTLRTTL